MVALWVDRLLAAGCCWCTATEETSVIARDRCRIEALLASRCWRMEDGAPDAPEAGSGLRSRAMLQNQYSKPTDFQAHERRQEPNDLGIISCCACWRKCCSSPIWPNQQKRARKSKDARRMGARDGSVDLLSAFASHRRCLRSSAGISGMSIPPKMAQVVFVVD